ncbi:hypothetical protein CDEST_04653 [Colletotrichum destructivum]|uniref:Uncharacterized protein n=1 Tax=Colletotrichum destructivum TaxID=34406 RepID=A0AAX4I8D7_9PEZI|nr:hypothetical protein CDEST_04653 [Colletotrichum destructivum]
MPPPTPDRAIHDCTFVILPLATAFVLIIFTVIALVYSIGVKAPIPENLAISFAGVVCALLGLWMVGHLVRYCRGHTRCVAEGVTPPPLPLTGIATTVTAPLVPQVGGHSIVLPISYQQQNQPTETQPGQQSQQSQYATRNQHQQRQEHQREYRHQQQQQHHHHQHQQPPQEPPTLSHIRPQPPPQSRFQHEEQPQREQQQPQQYSSHQQREQRPPAPLKFRPLADLGDAAPHRVPTALVPGQRRRQPPPEPKPKTDQVSPSIQRQSSVQRTPVESYTGQRSHSFDGPRPLHREGRQVSRETHQTTVAGDGPSGRTAEPADRVRCSPETQSRQGGIGQEPRSASIRSTSLDSGTRQSVHVRTSQLPATTPSGSAWANLGQPAGLTVAPLRIQKAADQSPAPAREGPFSPAWATSGRYLPSGQQTSHSIPNLHGPRPQPQRNRGAAHGPHGVRVVPESPPTNNASTAAAQPSEAEVRHETLAVPDPLPRPSSGALRFEDIDHPGVQQAGQKRGFLQNMTGMTFKFPSIEKLSTNPVVNLVIVPRYILANSQLVDLESGNARVFGVLLKETNCEEPPKPRDESQYKRDSGIVVEDSSEARRSSTSSRWSSLNSGVEISPRSSWSE